MWIALFFLIIVSLMIAINIGALRSGEDRSTTLHNLASLSGGLGIFFMLCVPISLLYAISNYMFGPAQDTSILFKGALIGACASTFTSLALSISIWYRGLRQDE
jgi:hypothetical protein